LFIWASLDAEGVINRTDPRRLQVKIHANAPLVPKGRALMFARVVDEGWTVK